MSAVILLLSLPTLGKAQTWTPLRIVDTSTANLVYQQDASTDVAVDGTVGVVWQEKTTDHRDPIIFARSTDRGETFQKHTVVDSVLIYQGEWGPGEMRTVHDFKFGPDGTVWVLWSFYLLYDFYVIADLRLSKSTDGGQTFTQVFNTERWGTTFVPRLAVAHDGSVFVLWDDAQFECTRFLRGDVSHRVDDGIPTGGYYVDYLAGIAVDSFLNVYCAWNGFVIDSSINYHWSIFLSVATDSGTIFSLPVRIDTSTQNQFSPVVAVSTAQSVYISYYRDVNPAASGGGRSNVVVARSSDGGSTFQIPTVLANPQEGGFAPLGIVGLGPSRVLVTWTYGNQINDTTWTYHTCFSQSSDRGQSFSPQVYIDSTLNNWTSVISCDSGGRAYMFCFAGRDGYPKTWYSTAQVIDGIKESGPRQFPNQVKLFPNYPNPFNPSTSINFELPVTSYVTLKVFNVLGEDVATLVNDKRQPGSYSVTFDASKLSSGIYFYRLVAEAGSRQGYTQTRKMLIIK